MNRPFLDAITFKLQMAQLLLKRLKSVRLAENLQALDENMDETSAFQNNAQFSDMQRNRRVSKQLCTGDVHDSVHDSMHDSMHDSVVGAYQGNPKLQIKCHGRLITLPSKTRVDVPVSHSKQYAVGRYDTEEESFLQPMEDLDADMHHTVWTPVAAKTNMEQRPRTSLSLRRAY
jgi:hypothetical protein